MSKPINVGLTTPRVHCLIIVLVLFFSGGWILKARSQTLTTLWSFRGTDGYDPKDGLVQGNDGNFYGTTFFGGINDDGTVFRIMPSGSLTNLHSFNNFIGEGHQPEGGLIQGRDGYFYGTTTSGGTMGHGTVFRMDSSGNLTNLHSFSGSDGQNAQAALVQGSDGEFYGTTYSGGASGSGTVFKITPTGNLTNLWSFTGGSDGGNPEGGLVPSSDGNFYGTTQFGGTSNHGTVFRISSAGQLTNLWTRFTVVTMEKSHLRAWVEGSDGNFYGTTSLGGANGVGTVFRISPSGNLTSLWSFCSQPSCSDGGILWAGLVQGSDGNFYGTTIAATGTVFQISPSGALVSLHSFHISDGNFPLAALVQGSDGNFYGTTQFGGTSGSGTVFRITVPLNPPANQIAGVQLSGTNIVFNIPSIAYETYQLQFSSSLNPTNWVNVPGVSVTNSIGALLTLTNFGGAVGPQGFYRFDITP